MSNSSIEDYTGQDRMQDGHAKTLSPLLPPYLMEERSSTPVSSWVMAVSRGSAASTERPRDSCPPAKLMLSVENILRLPILFATEPVWEEAAEDEDGGEEHGEERHPVVQVEPLVPAGVPHVVHHLGQSQLSTGVT